MYLARRKPMSAKKGLGPKAHETLAEGEVYEPYVPATESPPEFTVKAVVFGILFGVLFGAANAYLGLVAGLTISTSIPVAVMTVAAFRLLGKPKAGTTTLLEANMAQTVGSASSSVASGVIFTLPALFLWDMAPNLLQMVLLAMCGGLVGVLFMIPLRSFLIQREHGKLPYPEGTACAEVLVASEEGGQTARNVFYGLGFGALFKFIVSWAKLVPGKLEVSIPFLKKGALGCKLSAALFGVGYILGPRIAAIMVGGGLLSSLLIIPAIAYWGDALTVPFYPETELLISAMTPGQIWNRYVRYIGAGAVATGGIITLIKSVPTMIQSFKMGTAQLRERLGATGDTAAVPRIHQDLPLKFVGVGLAAVLCVLALVPQVFGPLPSAMTRVVAAVLVIICAFFFVTVSSRIVGLVGVTSNPTSGMTIATLLLTASVFLLMGWTDDLGKAGALTVGCVVAISASIAGDTSQDLKTGFLLGATPRRQQLGELLGVLTSATFVCMTVMFLGKATGFGTEELPAPQATLMKLVIEGVLDANLPWTLVGIGAVIAVACELAKIPSLPFAVGVYLPVATMVPVMLGGALRWWGDRGASEEAGEQRRQRGILFGSGLVGGEGLLGVGIAGAAGWAKYRGVPVWKIGYEWMGTAAPFAALVTLLLLAGLFWRLVRGQNGESAVTG
jgi:putative OPT family oligopeptide transporter